MKNFNLSIGLCLLLLISFRAQAQEEHCMHSSSGSLTPLGIMGDHTHAKGSWMFSYQFMHMDMRDNLAGREKIGPERILGQYMMAPGSMQMQMHMLMGMYAVSDRLSLMAMLPYMRNHMLMTDHSGMSSPMQSSHLGDVSISGIFNILNTHRQSLLGSIGLSMPSGSIQERYPMKHMHHHVEEMCLPYMMQTGSGTWDLLPSLTYKRMAGPFVYGLQGQGRLRTGMNSRNYRLGHMATLNSWLAYRQNSWLSYSLRMQALKNWAISGQDPELDPMMSPVSDVLNSGGEMVFSYLGSNFSLGNGPLKGQRLALEFGVPLYQQLNGIQMQGRWNLLAGWKATF